MIREAKVDKSTNISTRDMLGMMVSRKLKGLTTVRTDTFGACEYVLFDASDKTAELYRIENVSNIYPVSEGWLSMVGVLRKSRRFGRQEFIDCEPVDIAINDTVVFETPEKELVRSLPVISVETGQPEVVTL